MDLIDLDSIKLKEVEDFGDEIQRLFIIDSKAALKQTHKLISLASPRMHFAVSLVFANNRTAAMSALRNYADKSFTHFAGTPAAALYINSGDQDASPS